MRHRITVCLLLISIGLFAQKRITDIQYSSNDRLVSFERNDSLFIAHFNGSNQITITYYNDELLPRLMKTISFAPNRVISINYSKDMLIIKGDTYYVYSFKKDKLQQVYWNFSYYLPSFQVMGEKIILYSTNKVQVINSNDGQVKEYDNANLINVVDDIAFIYNRQGQMYSFYAIDNNRDSLFLGTYATEPNTVRIVNDTLYFIENGQGWMQLMNDPSYKVQYVNNYPKNRSINKYVSPTSSGYTYYNGINEYVLEYFSNSKAEAIVSLIFYNEVLFLYGNEDYFLYWEDKKLRRYDLSTHLIKDLITRTSSNAYWYLIGESDELLVINSNDSTYCISTNTWNVYPNERIFFNLVFGTKIVHNLPDLTYKNYKFELLDPVKDERQVFYIPVYSNYGISGSFVIPQLFWGYNGQVKDYLISVNKDTSYFYRINEKASISYIEEGNYYQILELKSNKELRIYHLIPNQGELRLVDSLTTLFDVFRVEGYGKYIRLSDRLGSNIFTTLEDLPNMYISDVRMTPLVFRDYLVIKGNNELTILDGVNPKIISGTFSLPYTFVTLGDELYGIGKDIIKYSENFGTFNSIGIDFDDYISVYNYKEINPNLGIWNDNEHTYLFDGKEVEIFDYNRSFIANDKVFIYKIIAQNLSTELFYYDIKKDSFFNTYFRFRDFHSFIKSESQGEFVQVSSDDYFTVYHLDDYVNKLDTFFNFKYNKGNYATGFFVGDHYVFLPSKDHPIIINPDGSLLILPQLALDFSYYKDETDLWISLFSFEHGFQIYHLDFSTNPVSVKPVQENLDLKIYPNPVANTLYIDTAQDASISIFDMQGRYLMSGSGTKYDVSPLKPGNYIILVHQNHNTSIHKIVKL